MISSYLSFKRAMLTTALALLPLAVVDAPAQNAARVQVPFPFLANHVALPAGHYEVLSSDSSLTLLDVNTRRAQAILVVRHETGNSTESLGRMTFEKSGSHFVLREVRFPGSTSHSVLLARPKRERVVALETEGATIELAMK